MASSLMDACIFLQVLDVRRCRRRTKSRQQKEISSASSRGVCRFVLLPSCRAHVLLPVRSSPARPCACCARFVLLLASSILSARPNAQRSRDQKKFSGVRVVRFLRLPGQQSDGCVYVSSEGIHNVVFAHRPIAERRRT